jgi:hypothetical protein
MSLCPDHNGDGRNDRPAAAGVVETVDSVAADDRTDRFPRLLFAQGASRGLWTRQSGSFWQFGRFGALQDMTRHYESCKYPSLAEQRRSELIEYRRSI